MNLKNLICEIPDFPKPGILFRDICPILANQEALNNLINDLSSIAKDLRPDLIAGIESRGFIIGTPLAFAIRKGFVPIRKPGKLPGEIISIDYTLEYGEDKLEVQIDSFSEGARVLIIDDLLATGGTASSAIKLVERAGGKVIGCLFVVELNNLCGRNLLPENIPIISLINYD